VQGAIAVEGYRECSRAFAAMGGDAPKELRAALAVAGEPVRRDAESLALANITNIGDRWSRQRLGITRTFVYIAPRARNRGGSPRPNLGPLLLNRAMWPAAKQHEGETVAIVEASVDKLKQKHGF